MSGRRAGLRAGLIRETARTVSRHVTHMSRAIAKMIATTIAATIRSAATLMNIEFLAIAFCFPVAAAARRAPAVAVVGGVPQQISDTFSGVGAVCQHPH